MSVCVSELVSALLPQSDLNTAPNKILFLNNLA